MMQKLLTISILTLVFGGAMLLFAAEPPAGGKSADGKIEKKSPDTPKKKPCTDKSELNKAELLLDAFEFQEFAESGEPKLIPLKRSVSYIDVNSDIIVKLNQQILTERSGASPAAARKKDGSPTTKELLSTYKSLKDILANVAAYLAESKRLNALYLETYGTPGGKTPEREAAIKAGIIDQSARGTTIFIEFEKYIGTTRKEEIDKILKEMKEPDREDAISLWMQAHEVNNIYKPAFSSFISAEAVRVADLASATAAEVKKRTGLTLTLQASLSATDGPGTQLHVSGGYDTVELGAYKPVERFTYALNQDDQARLSGSIEAYADIEKSHSSASASSSSVAETSQKTAQELVAQIKERIKDTGKSVREDTLKSALSVLQKEDPKSSKLNKTTLSSLASLAGETDSINANLKELTNLLSDPKQTTAQQLANMIASESALLKIMDSLVRLEPLLSDKAALTAIEADLKANADTAVASALDTVKKSAEEMRQQKTYLGNVVTQAQSLVVAQNFSTAASGVAFTDKAIYEPIETAKDAVIYVTGAARKENSTVQFKATVRDAKKNVINDVSKTFRLARFGFYGGPTAALILVSRIWVPKEDPDVNFAAAPTAAYMVGYRCRSEGHGALLNGLGRFWNCLEPSVGIHASMLKFTDSGSELGFGASASVLKGIVSVGYGYNLNVTSRRDYWYIGIGLLDLLKSFAASPGAKP
jgi:hypothetical protein